MYILSDKQPPSFGILRFVLSEQELLSPEPLYQLGRRQPQKRHRS